MNVSEHLSHREHQKGLETWKNMLCIETAYSSGVEVVVVRDGEVRDEASVWWGSWECGGALDKKDSDRSM